MDVRSMTDADIIELHRTRAAEAVAREDELVAQLKGLRRERKKHQRIVRELSPDDADEPLTLEAVASAIREVAQERSDVEASTDCGPFKEAVGERTLLLTGRKNLSGFGLLFPRAVAQFARDEAEASLVSERVSQS